MLFTMDWWWLIGVSADEVYLSALFDDNRSITPGRSSSSTLPRMGTKWDGLGGVNPRCRGVRFAMALQHHIERCAQGLVIGGIVFARTSYCSCWDIYIPERYRFTLPFLSASSPPSPLPIEPFSFLDNICSIRAEHAHVLTRSEIEAYLLYLLGVHPESPDIRDRRQGSRPRPGYGGCLVSYSVF
jgi:hypothetical protein